jgi:predicted Zn-dependent protease
VLEALARSQPAAAFIRLELAGAYCDAGRGAESVAALREALSIEPALAEGWRELSSQLAAAGDAHGADVAYERYAALASQPWQLAEPSAALADALARREAYVEAERLLHQALDLTPRLLRGSP